MVIEFEEIQLLILTWNSPYPKQYFIHIRVEPWHLYRLSCKIQLRGKLRTIPLFLAAISTTAAATAWAAWPWAAAFRRTSSWRTLLLDGVHFFFWVRTRSLRGRVIDEVWHDYSLQWTRCLTQGRAWLWVVYPLTTLVLVLQKMDCLIKGAM